MINLKLMISVIISGLLLCGSAHAAWDTLQTTTGCLVQLWDIGWKPTQVTWSGTCTAGKPIDSRGTLTILTASTKADGWWWQMTGSFANGTPVGTIKSRNEQFPDSDVSRNFNRGCDVGDKDDLKNCLAESPPLMKVNTPSAKGNQSPNSPRSVSQTLDPWGCPQIFVTTDQPGYTEYNKKYPFTNVEIYYSWNASRSGKNYSGSRTERLSALIHVLDNATVPIPVAAVSSADLYDCKADKWDVRILRWRDGTTQATSF
jgi:hypothetical protein